VKAKPSTPEDLVDINNVEMASDRKPGRLAISSYPAGPTWDAIDLFQPVEVSGSQSYLLENQFFEITNLVDKNGKPLYYKHEFFISGMETAGVTDLAGNAVTDFEVRNGVLYHSLNGDPYWVRYYVDGVLHVELLRYLPVMTRAISQTPTCYAFNPGGLITM
jgi:hypothetical protein